MIVKLAPDMIPESCWFTNVRSEISKSSWDLLRNKIYKRDNYRCVICGGKGNKWPVEAHEIWEYKNGVQALKNIASLCPACHQVKHFGLSQKRGLEKQCINKMMEVNNCNYFTTIKIINKTVEIWKERCLIDWELDIKIIEKYLA